ncbi:T6SS phospholipase effector Tle1-like catalytic domain-containing protein [Tardiphaga robiniae]|uniref:DUF2235 domain-containing protein n=1 Tax=Tardiphaga robiniae TaxID=943830 RepID=A0A7G6TTY8_9BRAD|nr:DUF2235 domain-containing protein [Tardiphaga robiniae]QND70220.1 DUF2235 domain-containing protein [Tardiphaga robiniae]
MPKNIIVYSDGTGQDGGVRVEQRISNVFKMYRASRVHPDNAIAPAEQVCFYDPGLGTDSGARGLTAIMRRIDKLLQSVTGRGITKNMADCYEFIINHYEPGDRIYLIGFSRGAYTVRCLANTIMLCGVPTNAENGPLLRYRKQIYDIAKEAVETVYEHGAGHARGEYEDERDEQARRFRAKYGSNFVGEHSDKDRSNAAAYFVGVFDTVAALGASGIRRFLIQAGLTVLFTGVASVISAILAIAPSLVAKYYYDLDFWWSGLAISATLVALAVCWFLYRQHAQYKKTIYDFPNKGDKRSHQAEWKSGNFDRLLSRYAGTARSANAIDERRKDFDRVTWGQADSNQLSQRWFAGNHSDIGGSYPETESRLSDITIHWMLEETLRLNHPVKFGPVTVNGAAVAGTGAIGTPLHLYPDATSMQHSEISGMRDTLDAFRERLPRILRGLLANANYEIIKRSIPHAAKVHPTVKERFALGTVIDCASDEVGNYRPEALREHDEFKQFYPDPPPADAPPPGKSDEPTLLTQLPP